MSPSKPFLPRRGRYRLAVIGLIAGAIASLLTCGSCIVLRLPYLAGPGKIWRTPTQQHNADVRIRQECKGQVAYGSGVVVSPTQVLTALHVVTCEDGSAPILLVDTGSGKESLYYVEVSLPSQDIARITTFAPTLASVMSPITIGPRPAIGDRVCEASSVPHWTYRCFDVQPAPVEGNNIYVAGTVELGNSGSGIYDSSGRLVGLLVTALQCQEFMCVGGVSPLQTDTWLIP